MRIAFLPLIALLLSACGNTSMPAETKAPPAAETSSTVPAPAADSGPIIAAAEPQPEASPEPPADPTPQGHVECYAGSQRVISELYYDNAKMNNRTEWQTKSGGSTWTTLPCTFTDL